jgi:anti-sigma factor RsiW
MKCERFRELMLPLALGRPEATGRNELERHLEVCPACQAELERTRGLVSGLQAALPPLAVDAEAGWRDFQARLRASQAEAEPVAAPWWRRWWLVPVPLAAAAGLVALGLSLAGNGPAPLPETDEPELVRHLELLEDLDCLEELTTLEEAGLLADPSEIERALEEVGG